MSRHDHPSVIVVGAGLGGLRLIESLRQHGYSEPITLVGSEPHPPYTRPPLSKELLRGEVDAASIELTDQAVLRDLGVEARFGAAATRLSVESRSVTAGSSELTADHIVIATGASARSLPGVSGSNVLSLRTVEDSIALQGFLKPDAKVVVIGAGFIGLEVAASARHLGCDVTIVDILEAPLARVVDPAIGMAIQALHTSHGVSFRLGFGVAGVMREGDRVATVRLSDGSALDADVVVVGIGAEPAYRWLESSGLELSDGVVCSATLAAAPGIWALGDVARWPHPPHDAPTRIEHWTNAIEQAQHIAASIVSGAEAPFEPVPYFWSDQYDAKLQSLGVASGDETRIVIGSLDAAKWTAFIRRGDRLAGVVGLRSAGQVMRRKPLVEQRVRWSEALATVPGQKP